MPRSCLWPTGSRPVARALFFYILDQRRVKREDIAVQFWPEFSNAKVNSNFHATLWRVRNALGKKNVIAFDGQYYSIQEQADVFYDVREFEELISRLRKSDLSDVERRSIFNQAIDLYGGDFVPELDLPWSDMRRLELREKYLSPAGTIRVCSSSRTTIWRKPNGCMKKPSRSIRTRICCTWG